MEVNAVNALGGPATPAVAPPEMRRVGDAEAERFAELVQVQAPGEAGPAEAQHGVLHPEGVEGPALNVGPDGRSLGDALVDGIVQVKHDYDASFARINEAMKSTEGREISMAQALNIQYELMQVGLQQELTAKLADKTSSGVQTLFRNQG